ncbi:hypothetical protein B0I37DRAFT_409035 [Chaetomium sp. MPI-CAGE-AT-0009]|nr:hypothetical protein B0I37DRAFT_409035 [Chaetomium sp. MPI-CAGE-AT-0009]
MMIWKQSSTAVTDDDPCKLSGVFPGWNVEPTENQKYLRYVKQIKDHWIHLRLLADFMQVGTHPQRWEALRPPPEARGENAEQRDDWIAKEISRKERTERTKVKKQPFDSSWALEQDFVPTARNKDVQFRLYVVEDLSRDVIEVLGSSLNIEPSFFRAHIVDYAWYNVWDRWRDPPILDVIDRQQNWMQVRYVTARYFETSQDFDRAVDEAQRFNILRRLDDDLSNKSWWDEKNAVMGLTRSRATFWLQPGHTSGSLAVGENRDINLPTAVSHSGEVVATGIPLLLRIPNPHHAPRSLLYISKVHIQYPRPYAGSSAPHMLRMAYNGRLHQDAVVSDRFRALQTRWFAANPQIELEVLNMWRRFIPLYREMISEALEQVFRCPYTLNKTPRRLGSVAAYQNDFVIALSSMEEYQRRIDRLTQVVTAAIQIADSRQALNDARNLGRLTWLAIVFIPFSLIASILSMQLHAREISGDTIKLYFTVSLPLVVATSCIAHADARATAQLGRLLGLSAATSDRDAGRLEGKKTITRILPQHRDAFDAVLGAHREAVERLLRLNGGVGYMIVGMKTILDGSAEVEHARRRQTGGQLVLPVTREVTLSTGMNVAGKVVDPAVEARRAQLLYWQTHLSS